MPQGIQLAGGFGAAGVRDALVDLIAQKRAEQEFAALQEERRLARDRQMMLDARAADETSYRRGRDTAEDQTRARERAEDLGERQRQFGIIRSEQDAAAQERAFEREMATKDKAAAREERARERKEDRAFTASENAKSRAASAARVDANERLVKVVGPQGKAIWVRESQAVGMPAGEPVRSITGQERGTLGFFNRMLEAEKNARGVEEKLGEKDLAAMQYAPGALENWLLSKEGQSYLQAQRMFTEARLRKESGAGIPMSEYEADRKTNFRMPNEKALANKRAGRLALLRSIGNAAGPALQEYYGEGASLDSLLSEFADKQAGATPGAGAPPPGGEIELVYDPKTGQAVRRP